jgi:hypothetical protein
MTATAEIPQGGTLRERMSRIEMTQVTIQLTQEQILEQLHKLPTIDRCVGDEAKTTAVEVDIKENIKPAIKELKEGQSWIMRTAVGSLISALISLAVLIANLITKVHII